MKRAIAVLLGATVLNGCAGPDIWDKPGATQADFNQDSAQCQMFAMGQPQYQAAQLPPTYTAQTSYSGTPYGGSAYTTVQAQPNPGQGFADLGAALGNIARQQQAMRVCMMSKGYVLAAKTAAATANGPLTPEQAKVQRQQAYYRCLNVATQAGMEPNCGPSPDEPQK